MTTKKKPIKETPITSINNCHFDNRNVFDSDTNKCLSDVAKALLNITEIYKGNSQNAPSIQLQYGINHENL